MPRALTGGARLRVVSLAAGRAGVRAGMTIAEAKARCAELETRPWDDHAIADAILAATTALLAASPQVTPATGTPGMWWVGATGFDALGGEEQLAHTLLTIAREWHPDARVAIADSCVAARAATWAPVARASGAQSTIIPPGGCAHYLTPAPLGLVPMPDELRDALRMLGLTTVGALAALNAGDVEQRWGAEGLVAWRLARGDDPRRPGLVRVEAARSASVELPGAVESAEPILFVLRAQLQRLVQQCVHDGRAAAAVAITLVLDAGRQYPIEEIGSELRGHVHVPETSDDSVPLAAVKSRKPGAANRAQPDTTPIPHPPPDPAPAPRPLAARRPPPHHHPRGPSRAPTRATRAAVRSVPVAARAVGHSRTRHRRHGEHSRHRTTRRRSGRSARAVLA
jgi:nucleotidyltransferase/DNA polymerase involved in DNA repair